MIESLPQNDNLQSFIDFCLGETLLAELPEVIRSTEAETSVRVNRGKQVCPPAAAQLVPWNDGGFYLDKRPKFTFDPALHQGLYYVQDASSMAVAHIVERLTEGCEPLLYLDACAAPGGKTTAAIDALPPGSLVLANEYDPRRAAALCENIERWGEAAVMVRRGDTSAFASMNGVFDIIAADVPCSGEGMMRKEPEAIAQWSPALVAQCAALQREIVANLWPALRPGGLLIYSTCTFNRSENEDNVRWIMHKLGAEAVATDLCSFPGVAPALDADIDAARFIPGRVRGEGLFVAVLRKPLSADTSQARPAGKKKAKNKNIKEPKLDKRLAGEIMSWLSGDFCLEAKDDGGLRALPQRWAETMRGLECELGGILMSGIEVAQIKGRDLIPSYALARAKALDAAHFPGADVDWKGAMTYLHREPVVLDGAPRGIVLLHYKGRPLGFVKNLGNRANNLLPASRRILSPTLPEDCPTIL